MIMQVHDELVFEVPEAEVEWVRTEIPRLMAGVADAEGAAAGRDRRRAQLGQGALMNTKTRQPTQKNART